MALACAIGSFAPVAAQSEGGTALASDTDQDEAARPFLHPGLLHSRADLERIREKVAAGEEPWASGFDRLMEDRYSNADYRMRGPLEEVGRNPGRSREFDSDANAAYQCAIIWSVTGDEAYATKSREIVDAWSRRLERVSGADAVLMAGLGPFKLINAAEVLRHTDPQWTDEHSVRAERMFNGVFYPALREFATFANGNWGTAANKTVMAIGVFCDDREVFEHGLRNYVNGAGNGRLTHYIINDQGQCQESGRDSQHSQLGLGHLGDCCEIAWNQGLDLYCCADNRLLKGFEYAAKHSLGEEVPFVETLDRTGKYHHRRIAGSRRRRAGRLRPVYEQIYNHYVHRVGVSATWTQRAAEQLRPEGAAHAADHPGFGTLLYSRRPDADPIVGEGAALRAPAGLVVEGRFEGAPANRLTWVASIGAASYIVKRAASPDGPFSTLAKGVSSNSFVDESARPGELYWYAVAATNAMGSSPDSLPTGICTGMPELWTSADVGAVEASGRAYFDGTVFTVEGAGDDIGGAADACHWVSFPFACDGPLVARFVPPFNSQFSEFGLMVRAGHEADAPHVSLLFSNERGRRFERPHWRARWVVRQTHGEDSQVVSSSPRLDEPSVTYGRMLEPYWLKLERAGDVFVGSISPDGEDWTQVGTTELRLEGEPRAGLVACSSRPGLTTRVQFDHVRAPGWKPPTVLNSSN